MKFYSFNFSLIHVKIFEFKVNKCNLFNETITILVKFNLTKKNKHKFCQCSVKQSFCTGKVLLPLPYHQK